MHDLSIERRYETQRARATRAGHEEIFRFWPGLDDIQRARLLDQVEQIDFDLIEQLCAELLTGEPAAPPLDGIEPVPDIVRLPETESDMQADAEARRVGFELIAAGKVAVLTVAGGQGTRLGYDGPKGTYPIGPVTDRSIFEWHALRLRATARATGSSIPWYIMTSTNYAATRDFLAAHDHFGLPAEDVVLFKQDTLAAVSPSGKFFLDRPDHVFESPNGHGGCLTSLVRSGALADMQRRGVEYISYFQVDNPLVPPADPRFVGHHALHNADMSAKVMQKRSWDEPVAVYYVSDGRLGVIEYTEVPDELAQRTDDDGNLVFWAGNPAIHIISVDFAERLGSRPRPLPYHRALKKIPYLDDDGRLVRPDEPNGYKFECFVFEAMAETPNFMLMEFRREEQYSPVKTLTGHNSVEAARQAMSNLFGSWLEQAGVAVPRLPDTNTVAVPIEISPLYAASAEELVRKLEAGTAFAGPILLE